MNNGQGLFLIAFLLWVFTMSPPKKVTNHSYNIIVPFLWILYCITIFIFILTGIFKL